MLVKELGGAGAGFEDVRNGGAGVDKAIEVDDSEGGHLRLGNQFQLCAGNGCEGAFAAGEKLAEVEAVDLGGVAELGAVEFIETESGSQESGLFGGPAFPVGRGLVLEQPVQETVEAVARDTAPVTGPALQDLFELGAHDAGDFAVNLRFKGVAAAADFQFCGGDRPEAGCGAVAEDYVCFQQVVGQHAVEDAVAAGGVVADRAADGGAVGAGRIGTQHEAEGGQCLVKDAYGDACLHSGGCGLLIDCKDTVHVFGRIDDQPGAHALTGQ